MNNTDKVEKILQGYKNEFEEILLEVIKEEQELNTKAKIKQQFKSMLTSKKNNVFANLIGFTFKWGKLEIDHCNGRSGESTAGDYIKRLLTPEIDKFLKSIPIPEIDDDMKKIILQEYNKQFQQRTKDTIRELAKKHANDCVQRFIKETSDDSLIRLIESEEKITNLLNI